MTPTTPEILADLAAGEGQTREFKRQLGNPESVAGEIVALANSDGGVLYFGVDDDESPVWGAGPDTLAMEAFAAYHELQFGLPLDSQLEQSRIPLETLLRNLRLAECIDGAWWLTVAGLLMFGKDPQQFMPQSRVSAVAFAGPDEDSDLLDRREIVGRLPEIIEDTRRFLERNIRQPAREQGFRREDLALHPYSELLGGLRCNGLVVDEHGVQCPQPRSRGICAMSKSKRSSPFRRKHGLDDRGDAFQRFRSR